jgi:hypothetical protein
VNEPGKPDIALCAICQRLVVDSDIVRYRNTRWAAYCWPCFKQKFLPNLTRLQEDTNEPGRLRPGQ